MSRKPRRRRGGNEVERSWWVVGSDETVRQFSSDRRDELLAEIQLEALELQVEAFNEALRLTAMLTMEQLAVLRAVMPHLHELPTPLQQQVMQLWQQTTARTNNLPALPGSYPPQGG